MVSLCVGRPHDSCPGLLLGAPIAYCELFDQVLHGVKLAGSVAQFLRKNLSSAAAHLGTALRHVWDRIRSQESKEAVLGCVLCLLNMHKKVES
ncbi:hypothetical protein EYF80_031699 [Liparis tanakae]|uniref:Uncharacterized protein n=1 Tax=Liparis tanakae TaxID=230148 RepID=A0A4Z2GXW0_9TELE|nr:hypothetical protein EYF80_031699 [Liparis tanakae]